MKKQAIEELRVKSNKELQQELEKREKELIEAKFKLSQGQLSNVHLPDKLRKDIAVVKTIMTEQSMAADQSGKGKENE